MAGVNKQRTYTPKEDASSQTVATKSIILASIVNDKENRYISFIDILNAFIQMRVKEKKDTSIINLRRLLVDIL